MDRFAMLLIASLGLACIYVGYKLFCGLPALRGDGPGASRAGVVLLNVIPGALLALAGAGILMADVHGATSHGAGHGSGIHRHEPATGASWHHRSGFFARSA